MLNDTERTCEIYRKAIAAGEDPGAVVGEIATWFDVQRPAIWKRLRAGGVIPPYNTKKVKRASRQTTAVRDAQLSSAPRVDRDPCPRCGNNPEHGRCKHSRAPVGMML